MTSLIVAALIGMVVGGLIALIPLSRQYRKDQRILGMLKRGEITMNQAREMRKRD